MLRWAILVCAVVAICVGLFLPGFFQKTVVVPHQMRATRSQYLLSFSSSTQPVTNTLACPDAASVTQNAAPSLAFCSPIYNGDVAGPYGTHLIVVADNFPSSAITWLLTQSKTLSMSDAQKCIQNSLNTCSLLPKPRSKAGQNNQVFYGWTWNGQAFPKNKGDYYINAIVTTLSPVQLVTSSLAFTLLSSQPPCITITTSTVSTDCSQNVSISLNTSGTIKVHGENWLLQDPVSNVSPTQQVVIMASCDTTTTTSQTSCSQPSPVRLLQTAISSTGTFSSPLPLSSLKSGIYTLTAENSIPQVITSNGSGSADTVASGALTFGETSEGDQIQLMVNVQVVTSAPATTTTTTTTRGTLLAPFRNAETDLILGFAVLAALPSVFAIVLFVFTWLTGRKAFFPFRRR